MNQTASGNKTVALKFHSQEYLLNGTLHLPENRNPPVIIGVHGLAANGDSPKQIALALACNALGMAFFRFDHRGCGQSEGVFEEVTSLESRCRDLSDAAKLLSSREDLGERLGLFGSSMGGTTVLASADELSARASVVFAAPTRGSSIVREPARLNEHQRLSPEFYDRHINFDIEERLGDLHHILVMHGEKDEIVPMENAHRIYRRAGNPKELIIQEGGDHRMSDPLHQKPFIETTSRWFEKHLL